MNSTGGTSTLPAKAFLVLAALTAITAGSVIAQDRRAEPNPTDRAPTTDDPAALRKYFETHPHEVVEGTLASPQVLAALAESAAGDITFNGYKSVQVNINSAGNNIMGDAANEPSLAIDPTDPSRIVIGWRQFDTITNNFRQAGMAYSHDGGATWTFPGVLDPGQFRSDPVLAADGFGNFYYSSLSTLTTIEVFTSTDSGVTWGVPVPAFGGDKQWLAVDKRTSGMGAGHIYQDWNIQFTCCSGSDFTRSTNGGASFGSLVGITPPSLKWGTLDVGPDGTLYVAGAQLNSANGHLFTKSLDALNPIASPTFDSPSSVSPGGTTAIGGGFGSPNPVGLLGQLWIVAHPTNLGEIYVLGSVNPPGTDPLDVMFIRSLDNGATWSAPVRVNDDAVGADNWQWFGTMSVAPNGRIDVIWNDTRVSGVANVSALFYSFSTDGGATWTANTQVSPSFNSHLSFPSQNKIGDYYGMISDNGSANIAYSATFNGEQDVYFLRTDLDCNDNGIDDDCEVACGPKGSRCDVTGCGTATDCNGNQIPDSCEPTNDCNGNEIPDICDIAGNPSLDCNGNLLIDSCEDSTDCNKNGDLDICELATGTAFDCNDNGQLDVCDVAANPEIDSDGDNIPDECEGACCGCSIGCQLLTPAQCGIAGIEFSGLTTACEDAGACVPPPSGENNACSSAESLPGAESVSVPFDNTCATTDGPSTVACPANQPFGTDLWYSYVPPRSGTLIVSTCDEANYDGMLAVYSNGSGTCACPTTNSTLITCGDDTCGQGGGPAAVTLPVAQGICYLIRLGGWNGSTGSGTLKLSFTNAPPPVQPPPDAENSHLPKNRFISFSLPQLPPGENFAIRVRLTSLHHPELPPDAPDFSAFESDLRFVNLLLDSKGDPVTICVDSPANGTSFGCATLGCSPQYLDWPALFGDVVIHVTGDAVVPTSIYDVSMLPSDCAGVEATCVTASDELTIATALWGDVAFGKLDVLDITQMVDTLKQLPEGILSEPHSLLRDSSPTPQTSAANVFEITLVVDGLKREAYPYTIAPCP